jgi:hypothetical protein
MRIISTPQSTSRSTGRARAFDTRAMEEMKLATAIPTTDLAR